MPRAYDETKPLVSIHVPKTGGSTIRKAMETWFAEKLCEHYVTEAESAAPKQREQAAGACVHGHFNRFRGFGVDDHYPQSEQFLIFLRDPFEQHVSLFHYLRGHRENYKFNGAPVAPETIQDFSSFFESLQRSREQIQTTCANTFLAHLPGRFEGLSARELFEDKFIHMGLTEVLEQSLDLLAKKLGKQPLRLGRENVSPKSAAVDTGLRSRHEALFPLEHALFRELRQFHLDELRVEGFL